MADAQTTSQRVVAGRYRLIEPLGRGGMGVVWRAVDQVLERDVAVKELRGAAGLTGPDRETFIVRTFREARAAGRLSHPSVAAVYDVFEEGGHPWIVLQLVRSRTLGSIIREEGALPPRRVAEIGAQVLAALRAAHAAGVLHRDVKPDNVLITDEGRAVLTDFGIAAMDDDAPLTHTDMLVGTPAFIAPERAAGARADRASDLWSLGVTMFLAAEGRSPFHRGHALATLAAVMYEPPGPMHRAGPLAPVINGLLAKDPAYRMTAEEAARHLHGVATGRSTGGGAPTGPLVPAQRPRPRGAPRPGAAAEATEPTPVPSTPGYGSRPYGRFDEPPPPPPALSRTGGTPWHAAVGATALIALVGLTVGGLAFVTARTDAAQVPGSSISTPTVTVYATRTASPPAAEPAAGPRGRPEARTVADQRARPAPGPATGSRAGAKTGSETRSETGSDRRRDAERSRKPSRKPTHRGKPTHADRSEGRGSGGSTPSPSGDDGPKSGKVEPSEGDGAGNGDTGGPGGRGDGDGDGESISSRR
ncbi:serine/threonine-protein kinase [Sphaerimonospora mesophila]|uniref:serine/threonine-protein kinase n=1 Tax=Sphaerimonospora mesophila TaxID=37483 RepID=UPI000A47CE17